jgi:hypothetical protein
MMKVFFQFA